MQILEAYVSQITAELSAPSGPDSGVMSYGFVYLARGHRGEYKIGRTNLVDRRIAEVGATSSVELTLIHEIKTDDPAGARRIGIAVSLRAECGANGFGCRAKT